MSITKKDLSSELTEGQTLTMLPTSKIEEAFQEGEHSSMGHQWCSEVQRRDL